MGPIMMANVVERDGNNRIISATQTDMMGNFSMEIKNPKNKLVISYVGSKTKILPIGNQKTFKIKLEDDKTVLGEVKVVGRRTNAGGLNIDKREISVSQQTMNMAEVEGMAFTSADVVPSLRLLSMTRSLSTMPPISTPRIWTRRSSLLCWLSAWTILPALPY